MNSTYIKLLASAALLGAMAACDDNDDFKPGPKTDENCMSVYFPVQDSYSHIFASSDESKTFTVTAERLNTDEAAIVPLSVTSSVEGISAPASIYFAQGQSSATLTFDCAGLPAKQTATCSISIPQEYANPYAAGSPEFDFTALVSDWELWVKDAEFVFENYYNPVYSDIYAMPGTTNFKISNFFGSGIDVSFRALDVTAGAKLPKKTRLFPTDNLYDNGDEYSTWYLVDDANNWEYPTWSPDGESDIEIEYLNVYGWDGDDWWSYIDFEGRKGEFTSSIDYSDGSSGWDYVTFSFGEPLFNL